jgi:hypothetical protein
MMRTERLLSTGLTGHLAWAGGSSPRRGVNFILSIHRRTLSHIARYTILCTRITRIVPSGLSTWSNGLIFEFFKVSPT